MSYPVHVSCVFAGPGKRRPVIFADSEPPEREATEAQKFSSCIHWNHSKLDSGGHDSLEWIAQLGSNPTGGNTKHSKQCSGEFNWVRYQSFPIFTAKFANTNHAQTSVKNLNQNSIQQINPKFNKHWEHALILTFPDPQRQQHVA